MSQLSLPRTLIVIQVIFGRPLRPLSEFRSGHVEALVAADIGLGNYSKVLNNLVELGWLTRHEIPEATRSPHPGGGRPARYAYRRTKAGQEGYAALKLKLSQYGISLL